MLLRTVGGSKRDKMDHSTSQYITEIITVHHKKHRKILP